MSTLKAFNLVKTFPGVVALDKVDLEIHGGTVHALVGANGAGKSTLIKVLSGYYPTYQGRIELDNTPVRPARPADALRLGIEVVHQEVDTSLIPYLSVAENLLIEKLALGHGQPVIQWGKFYQEAAQVAQRVGFAADVRRRVEDLSLHEKQLLVIARAVSRQVRFLIMDEPTASLSSREVGRLFEIIRTLKQQGVGVIYISHRLAEVGEIADEISVLRGGRKVAHFKGRADLALIVEAMLGAPAEATFPARTVQPAGEVVLETHHLSRRGQVHDVSFELRRGEILGITGLVGAGKTELARLLFGAERADSGEIRVAGRPVRFLYPGQAVKHGIFLIPEERRRQGLWLDESIRVNLGMPFLEQFSRLGWLLRRLETRHAYRIINQVALTPPQPKMPAGNLSGGNQQKVVIGKWLGGEPQVMIFDEATHGIDVGAKREVYELAQQLRAKAGIIYISADIDEVLGLADRVLVMREGRLVAELEATEGNRQVALEYATGLKGEGRLASEASAGQ